MPYHDPADPPEGGAMLKALDTVGQFALLRVTGEHNYPATPAVFAADGSVEKEAKKAQRAIECDVWLFDRAGFLEGTSAAEPTGQAVRFGWWKAVDVLDKHVAQYGMDALMGCRPMQESDSNARYLQKLGPQATAMAKQLSDEIDAVPRQAPAPAADSTYEDLGEEPF